MKDVSSQNVQYVVYRVCYVLHKKCSWKLSSAFTSFVLSCLLESYFLDFTFQSNKSFIYFPDDWSCCYVTSLASMMSSARSWSTTWWIPGAYRVNKCCLRICVTNAFFKFLKCILRFFRNPVTETRPTITLDPESFSIRQVVSIAIKQTCSINKERHWTTALSCI